jgi:hypothetical protein
MFSVPPSFVAREIPRLQKTHRYPSAATWAPHSVASIAETNAAPRAFSERIVLLISRRPAETYGAAPAINAGGTVNTPDMK